MAKAIGCNPVIPGSNPGTRFMVKKDNNVLKLTILCILFLLLFQVINYSEKQEEKESSMLNSEIFINIISIAFYKVGIPLMLLFIVALGLETSDLNYKIKLSPILYDITIVILTMATLITAMFLIGIEISIKIPNKLIKFFLQPFLIITTLNKIKKIIN